jgi:hypothetical protein
MTLEVRWLAVLQHSSLLSTQAMGQITNHSDNLVAEELLLRLLSN